MEAAEKKALFDILKGVFRPFVVELVCATDEPGHYDLFTRHRMQNGKPLYFGGVKINKSFVSFHLMPLYVFPELVQTLPDALKLRLKGKSCFNLKQCDEATMMGLHAVTRSGFEHYRRAGYLD